MSQVSILNHAIIPPGIAVQTLTSNNGIAVPPSAGNNINLIGGNNITGTGVAATNTITFNLTGTTDHAVQVGNAGGSLTSIGLGTDGQTLIGNTGANPSFAAIGTLSGLTAHSIVLSQGAGAFTALGTATNGQIPIGSVGVNPVLATISSGNNITVTNGAGTISVAVTGTTNHSLQLGNGTGSLTSLGVATNGQLPIGSTGVDPVLATLTQGTNIAITNTAGSITIATSGVASFVWSVINADQAAVVNNGYICNKAGTLILTLPATAIVGDLIRVTGINTATGWQIAQNANQQIFIGNVSTTLGVGGSITSTAIRDSIELVCVVAGAASVYNCISQIGNLNIV